MEPKPVVQVSKPTFAELSSRLAQAGHIEALQASGDLRIGDLHIEGTDRRSRARVAHTIAEAAAPMPGEDGVLFDNGEIRVIVKCRGKAERVHLIVHSIVNARSDVVALPRECVAMVSAGLIDCLVDSAR